MDDGWDAGDVEDIGSDWDPWQGALDQDLPEGIEIIRDDDRDWHDEEYAEENESSDDEDSADEDLPPEDGPTFDPRPSGGGTRNPLLDDDPVGGGHSDGRWGGFFGGASHGSGEREDQPEDDGDSEDDPGILERLSRWWKSLFGGKSEAEEPEPIEVVIDAAEQCVADFSANGADEHEDLCQNDPQYRGSMEHAIACQKEALATYLERYEADANSSGRDALIADDFWGPKIAVVLDAIHDAERTMQKTDDEAAEIEAKWHAGRLSRSAYDDAMHNVARRIQRAITRLEMGGLGMTYDELGEVSDQSTHAIQDALQEDDGELRQEIARRIRNLPRQVALDMLDRAVADGAIPQQVADYLRREYVRSR